MHLLLVYFEENQANDSTFNYEQKYCEYAQTAYEFNWVESLHKEGLLGVIGQEVM